jgi:hypothetical protein
MVDSVVGLVGLCALVVCFLKGRWLRGFMLVAGTAAVMLVAHRAGIIVGATGALVLALSDPVSGSWWDRFHGVDQEGNRILSREPRSRRTRRAALGVLVGVVPGTIGLSLALTMTPGDVAAIGVGLSSIGAIVFGAVVGGIIGFNWVPRDRGPLISSKNPG